MSVEADTVALKLEAAQDRRERKERRGRDRRSTRRHTRGSR